MYLILQLPFLQGICCFNMPHTPLCILFYLILASACISLELHICSVCGRIEYDHDDDDDDGDISVRSLRRQLHQVDPVFAFHSLLRLRLSAAASASASLSSPLCTALVLFDFCENYAKCNFKLTCFMRARINLWHSQFNTHFSASCDHAPAPIGGTYSIE